MSRRTETVNGTDYDVYRTTNDVNGNPRYIMHWCSISEKSYEDAIDRVHRLGGRKYHYKAFGGGVCFTSYNLKDSIERMLEN